MVVSSVMLAALRANLKGIVGECGGCQYQNLAYPQQLEWKRHQVAEAFERLGGRSGSPGAIGVRGPGETQIETDRRLIREGRMELAQQCFDFLPTRAALDLADNLGDAAPD